MKLHLLGSLLLSSMLLLPVSESYAQQDPAGVAKEREAVRKKLDQLKKNISETTSERKKVINAIEQLEERLNESKNKLVQLDKERAEYETDIRDLIQQEVEVERDLAATEKRLARVLRNQYQRNEVNPTQAWLSGKSASEAARESYWFERVSQAEKELADRQEKQSEKLHRIRTGLETKQDKLEKTIERQKQRERELAGQREERKQLEQDLNSKLKDQELQQSRLERDEKRMTNVINQLTAAIEAAKRKSAEERAKAQKTVKDITATTAEKRKAEKTLSLPAPVVPDSGDFAQNKGRLRLPVQGTITGRFGSTRAGDGTGPSWKGIFIVSGAGEKVQAAGSGRVVFAEWLRGFGEIVIIDHGDQFLSVYGNNSKLLKSAGEVVKSGEVIAEVGNSSGNLETGLYFELRYRGQPFDPLSWTK
jgi:murein hydrolase activator